MSQRVLAIAILCALASFVASCASPKASFYELSPMAMGPSAPPSTITPQGTGGKAKHAYTQDKTLSSGYSTTGLMTPACTRAKGEQATPLSVAVGPVSVPEIVDRPQMVIRINANQVSINEFKRWAAPLQSNIASVVAQNLVYLLQTPRVAVLSKETSPIGNFRAAIEVQRFDSMPGKAAELDATWTVTRLKDHYSRTGRTTVREPVHNQSYDALVAAHSLALARLSRDIAQAICALDQQ